MVISANVRASIARHYNWLAFDCLSDVDCNDPLGWPYTDRPFVQRNVDRVEEGAIPQVRQFENGDTCVLTEASEHLWFHSWRVRTTITDELIRRLWERNTRNNAALTNFGGSNECHSWILGTKPDKKGMKTNGVLCMGGGNILRAADDGRIIRMNNRDCIAVWNLDYPTVSKMSVTDAKKLAEILPRWLLHIATSVHPEDGHVTRWDYDFRYPLWTSDTGKPFAWVDGFPCRYNYLRASRLKRIA